jgi:hypothetical protein
MDDDQTIVIRLNPAHLLLPGLALISALFLTIAAFGPWASMVGVTSVSGMDDNGALILPLAVIAALGAVAYIVRPDTRIWLAGIMLAAFGMAAFLAAIDWIAIADEGYAPLRDAEVGWGVQLAAVSATIGALFSFAALMEWALAPEAEAARDAQAST